MEAESVLKNRREVDHLTAFDNIQNSKHLDIGKIWDCTRLDLNSTPFPQEFKLLGWCAEVKPKFAFLQE